MLLALMALFICLTCLDCTVYCCQDCWIQIERCELQREKRVGLMIVFGKPGLRSKAYGSSDSHTVVHSLCKKLREKGQKFHSAELNSF